MSQNVPKCPKKVSQNVPKFLERESRFFSNISFRYFYKNTMVVKNFLFSGPLLEKRNSGDPPTPLSPFFLEFPFYRNKIVDLRKYLTPNYAVDKKMYFFNRKIKGDTLEFSAKYPCFLERRRLPFIFF